MRLPNGFGTAYKLSGKRHKPWAARIFVGRELNGDKLTRKYKYVGYYRTKKEALDALALYRENPHVTTGGTLTFTQVFERWQEDNADKMSSNTLRSWNSAYYCCKILYNQPMASLRVIDLESVIKTAKNLKGEEASLHMKNRIKSLYNHLYRYSLKHDIVEKDYAKLVDPVPQPVSIIERIPYSAEEREMLFNNQEFPFVKMLLVGIYSGWRPSELCQLRTENIDLETGTMKGGVKTKAGINRIVPIHSKIFPIINEIHNPDNSHLFMADETTPMDYERYRKRNLNINKRFGMTHKPHDTRHTFVTMAKSCDLNEYLLKRIIGHEVSDVTEAVYTHRTIEDLKNEIEKINI